MELVTKERALAQRAVTAQRGQRRFPDDTLRRKQQEFRYSTTGEQTGLFSPRTRRPHHLWPQS